MAVYADYEFYTDEFYGSAIAEADFSRLAFFASKHIDRLTFGRAAGVISADEDAEQVAAIQYATCAVAEQLQTNDGDPAIQSERVGQHSVTYALNATATLSDDGQIARAAKEWLGSTGLMFAGFNDGEYSGTYAEDE